MTNKRPRVIWMWCWKVISPLLIVVILVFSIWGLSKGTASYNVWDKDKVILQFFYHVSSVYSFKVILFSAPVTLQTFICKTGIFRKLSITFYSFGLKQFGTLHVVSHKLLRFEIYKV